MAITIKNNTDKLQNLKNKVNALPDREGDGGTVVLDQTTAYATDILVDKSAYIADTDGKPIKVNGEMANLGTPVIKVGLNGTGQNTNYGYITGATATFSEEVNNEIDTQAELIAQIKSVLNNKIVSGGGSSDEALKALIDKSITEIVIPDSTTSIGTYAFYKCTSLSSIEIPDSVTDIESSAFNACTSLESVRISNNIKNIRSGAFSGCTSLKSVEIPDSMVFIERATFYNCTSLESVVIGSGFSTLATGMFEGCTSLKNILIPNNITRINGSAFYDCTSLIYVTIPDSVTRIESKALQIGSSDNKATIRFEGITPPTISSDTFDISKLDKIEVLMSAVDTYKAATNWSNFVDYIVGY